jgi:ATP-dependent phosphofructokinase / diphosphate-dependent phosphofructokinase
VKRRGWSLVVLPETMRTATGQHFGGDEPEYVDGFGHPYFPSTGAAMTRLVSQRLHLRARYDKPGTAARMSMALASETDLAEAYQLGAAAVERLADGESGFMTALERVSDDPYRTGIVSVPLERIANRVRHLEDAFIGADGMSVTEAFRAYMRPILGPDPFPVYGRFA